MERAAREKARREEAEARQKAQRAAAEQAARERAAEEEAASAERLASLPLQPPPPPPNLLQYQGGEAIYTCEHNCGFTGTFETVSNHEATCMMGSGAVSTAD